MKLFRTRFSYLYICFSFFLAAALWYTVKIDCLDRAGELKEAGRALLDFGDVSILLLGTAFLFSFTAQTGRSAFQLFLFEENGSRSDMVSSCIPSDGALADALPSLVLSGAGNE